MREKGAALFSLHREHSSCVETSGIPSDAACARYFAAPNSNSMNSIVFVSEAIAKKKNLNIQPEFRHSQQSNIMYGNSLRKYECATLMAVSLIKWNIRKTEHIVPKHFFFVGVNRNKRIVFVVCVCVVWPFDSLRNSGCAHQIDCGYMWNEISSPKYIKPTAIYSCPRVRSQGTPYFILYECDMPSYNIANTFD